MTRAFSAVAVALLVSCASSGPELSDERTCETAVANIFALSAERDSIASGPINNLGEASDVYERLVIVHERLETVLIQARSRCGDSALLEEIEAVVNDDREALAEFCSEVLTRPKSRC